MNATANQPRANCYCTKRLLCLLFCWWNVSIALFHCISDRVNKGNLSTTSGIKLCTQLKKPESTGWFSRICREMLVLCISHVTYIYNLCFLTNTSPSILTHYTMLAPQTWKQLSPLYLPQEKTFQNYLHTYEKQLCMIQIVASLNKV